MGLEPDGGVGETQHRLLMVEEGMTLSYTASHHISVPSFIEPVSRQLITGPAFWNFVGPNVTVMVCMCVCVCVCVCVYTHIYILHAYMCIYTCTLCDPVGCSPPGSSVHGISQARILHRWLLRFPGDLPDPGTELESPAMAGGFFTTEPPGRPTDILAVVVNSNGLLFGH